MGCCWVGVAGQVTSPQDDGPVQTPPSNAEMDTRRGEPPTRMAGDVAHDLANLLTVILGYTELVLGELGPDHPSSPELQEVQRSAEQAGSLVKELLTLRQPVGHGSKR